ncbi:gluconokinase [Hyphomonas oceanitis]|uniref:Gluconokinase n=1 Tax=Hyphomonas oceanitis SCH89 TaxID=1280953 RepID=A0A059GBM4_9PROT|nr:gluconokinase, GntK/IdnK-type [Hyphomonas oceanitis]KDA03950.1 putative gluconokinase [Hyphomonas oceanitis SCH89]
MRDLVIVMGVAGSGKTTVGAGLAEAAGWPFVEADAFHPDANREKMASGTPLTDEDRAGWISAITAHVAQSDAPRMVLACSALTRFVQARLVRDSGRVCRFVWLDVPADALRARMASRAGHFMPVSLLDSQLAALDVPDSAERINAMRPVSELVQMLQEALPSPDPA